MLSVKTKKKNKKQKKSKNKKKKEKKNRFLRCSEEWFHVRDVKVSI